LNAADGEASPPVVSLVTVTYNSAATLNACWMNLGIDWAQWVVVDNCSSDRSAEVARDLGATVIELPRNMGFSAANNIGVEHAKGDVLVFCNPDVVVDQPGIDRLAHRAASTGAIVAPQLTNPDGSLQENGRGAPYPHRKLRHMFGSQHKLDLAYARIAHPGQFRQVVWVMGAAVAMSRGTFDRIGGWNDGYFIYYEDAEICLRALESRISTYVDGDVNWQHGWARETSRGFSMAAWKREVASAVKFYSGHLECLLPVGAIGKRLREVDAIAQ
jgi:N-acetylglucosaminyl-diphospho-decaprenol L-rhamnosyltransferase